MPQKAARRIASSFSEKDHESRQKTQPKAGFAPISIEKYVELHLKSNPEDQRKDVVTRLK
jgi:hypothetical protein